MHMPRNARLGPMGLAFDSRIRATLHWIHVRNPDKAYHSARELARQAFSILKVYTPMTSQPRALYHSCPRHPEAPLAAVEYRGTSEDYDGTSEWACTVSDCTHRAGRWTKQVLPPGFIEPRYGGRFTVSDPDGGSPRSVPVAEVAVQWLNQTQKTLSPYVTLREVVEFWGTPGETFAILLAGALEHHIGSGSSAKSLRKWLLAPERTMADFTALAQWACKIQ